VGEACRGAEYYLAAAEAGGVAGHMVWSRAEQLAFTKGRVVEREPYELLFGSARANAGKAMETARGWALSALVPMIAGRQRSRIGAAASLPVIAAAEVPR